jgi:5,5'-dehydrodivanillate O-demethylase
MLSNDENKLLTLVGRGTPAGELLRRYWHPVAVAAELTTEKPKKRLKILGEDLVLFRDQSGRYGLLADHCSHRGTSLYYGFVEEDGLRCAYHGWKYDVSGNCLEQPFEPKEAGFKEKVCQPAYSLQKMAGLLFAYLGPKPEPLLPRWDILVREDGTRSITVLPLHDCNWLQAMENSVDPVHTYYLHGHTMRMKGLPGGEYYYRPIEELAFEEVSQPAWAGILKKRVFKGDDGAEHEIGHPLVFPNMLYAPQGPRLVMHWRVPMDDTHTHIFWMEFNPSKDGRPVAQPEDPPVEYVPSQITPDGEHELTSFPSQDRMAWETQGAIFDRTQENLGASDRGITMYRKMLRDQIKIVQQGGEPLGVIRDPELNRRIDFTVSRGQAAEKWVKTRVGYSQSRVG